MCVQMAVLGRQCSAIRRNWGDLSMMGYWDMECNFLLGRRSLVSGNSVWWAMPIGHFNAAVFCSCAFNRLLLCVGNGECVKMTIQSNSMGSWRLSVFLQVGLDSRWVLVGLGLPTGWPRWVRPTWSTYNLPASMTIKSTWQHRPCTTMHDIVLHKWEMARAAGWWQHGRVLQRRHLSSPTRLRAKDEMYKYKYKYNCKHK